MSIKHKIINIAVIAHVDAGKSTLVDAFLSQSGVFRANEVVKECVMDSNDLEAERGITIYSKNCSINYKDYKINIVDTPGHIDFSPDMERAISIMDYAVIIISAIEKVQSHTKTVFRLLRKYNVPTIFFVNKIDREGANLDEVISDIKNSLTSDVINISDNSWNWNKVSAQRLFHFFINRKYKFMSFFRT